MALRRQTDRSAREILEEWPSWIIPALIGGTILVLSAGFLYYYFGPTVDDLMDRTPRATSRTTEINVRIADTPFIIPANYTRFARNRSDGRHEQIELHALQPNMDPFSEWNREDFENYGPQSRVVQFEISEIGNTLDAQTQFNQVYRKYLATPRGEETELGLTRYMFRVDSGYENRELFLKKVDNGSHFIIMCFRKSTLVPAPHCTHTQPLNDKLVLTYRFKRYYLEEWQKIHTEILRVVKSFGVGANNQEPSLRLKILD